MGGGSRGDFPILLGIESGGNEVKGMAFARPVAAGLHLLLDGFAGKRANFGACAPGPIGIGLVQALYLRTGK